MEMAILRGSACSPLKTVRVCGYRMGKSAVYRQFGKLDPVRGSVHWSDPCANLLLAMTR